MKLPITTLRTRRNGGGDLRRVENRQLAHQKRAETPRVDRPVHLRSRYGLAPRCSNRRIRGAAVLGGLRSRRLRDRAALGERFWSRLSLLPSLAVRIRFRFAPQGIPEVRIPFDPPPNSFSCRISSMDRAAHLLRGRIRRCARGPHGMRGADASTCRARRAALRRRSFVIGLASLPVARPIGHFPIGDPPAVISSRAARRTSPVV